MIGREGVFTIGGEQGVKYVILTVGGGDSLREETDVCSSVLGTHIRLCLHTHIHGPAVIAGNPGCPADIAAPGHTHRVPSNAAGARARPLAAWECKDII